MHQVTETTIQDFIDRSIAFTHRAFVVLRTLGKFNYADLTHTFRGDCNRDEHALTPVLVTLHQDDERGSRAPIHDKDGNLAQPLSVAEGPYSYSISAKQVHISVPYFMLAFAAGFKDLMDLLENPENPDQMCHYTWEANRRLMNGSYPKTVQDFSTAFWQLAVAPSDADNPSFIPELRQSAQSLHCLYDVMFHEPGSLFRSDQPLWHVREEARLRLGIYDPLPEAAKELLDPVKTAALFPHLPIKSNNAGMIAYTQNTTHGVMDRQTVARTGRFLRQFAKDGVCDEEVKQMAAHIASTLSSQFKHSREREDYKRVYISGPSSCMSYDESGKGFGRLMVDDVFVHPCEVYAHPDNDLEIVWCEVQDNIVARTIINKKRMQYPRIYAKESVGNAEQRLKGYLEDLGYTQYDHALADQKLLRISPTKYPRAIICPYIDSSNLGVEVHDDHLVTGGGESADHETGCLSDYNTNGSSDDWCCECCDTEYDDDDGYEMNSGGDRICQSCSDNDHVQAYCTHQMEEAYVHDDETIYTLVGVNRGALRHYSRVFFNSSYRDMGHYELVELSDSYYDSYSVALADDCVIDDNSGYILLNDLDEHGLFFNQDDGEACEISDYAIQVSPEGDPELTRVSDIDEDLFEHAPAESDDTYPMLQVYTEIPVTQDEEAA
jgi:hypothetical protein